MKLRLVLLSLFIAATAFATNSRTEKQPVIFGLGSGITFDSGVTVDFTNATVLGLGGAITVDWADLTGTPTSLAGYGIADPIALTTGSYANPSWITSLAWAKLTGVPIAFPPDVHTHSESDVTNLVSDLAAKQPLDGDLTAIAALTGTNTIYYRSATNTWTPVTISTGLTFSSGTLTALSSLAWGNITGTLSAQSDLQTALNGKQPLDADLTAIAALSGTNNIYYRSASNTWSSVTIGPGLDFTTGTLSATGSGTAWGDITGTLSDQTDLQSALDAKQGLDSDLTTLAGLTATTDNFVISVGSAWASRTPSQARTTLGLVIGTNVEAWDTQLDSLAALSYSSNALKVVRVNSGATGFELATPTTGTVTNSTNLAEDYIVLGTGTTGTKVLNEFKVDGSGQLTLGFGGGSTGSLMFQLTSGGTTTFSPTNGIATNTLTVPATTGTLAVTSDITASAAGLGNVTNDVQTKAAIVPNTAPSAGQILVGNAGGTAYAPASVSGSGATISLASTGVMSISSLALSSIASSTSTALGVGSLELGAASDTTLSRASAGVLAVEGVNVLLNGGALGTPSSGTLTNATGLPISGLTSSTSTALGVGSIELGAASDTTIARSGAGAITVEGTAVLLSGGALGTPSSGTLTNATGLPIAGLTSSTSTALGVGSIELGAASDTTLSRASAGVLAVEGTNVLLNGGALGTPSSGTLTNATGLPVSGITSSTSTALGVGSIELGAASDTTIARSGAGAITVEGVAVPTISSTNTLTNKAITPRVTSISSNATWSPNADTDDVYEITAQAADATTISNPSGSPVNGQKLIIRVTGTAARALTWSGSQWRASSDLPLPTTTTTTKTMYLGFIYNTTGPKWDLVAKLDNF